MEKICKVVMLPSNKKAKLYIDKDGIYTKNRVDQSILRHNLYVLFKEDIKDDDYFVENDNIYQAHCNFVRLNMDKTIFKVIATTNNNLGNKIIPSISRLFIEKFVSEYNKENRIKQVIVEYHSDNTVWDNLDNTINIKLTKDTWNKEEVKNLLYKLLTDTGGNGIKTTIDFKNSRVHFDGADLDKWIETNLC